MTRSEAEERIRDIAAAEDIGSLRLIRETWQRRLMAAVPVSPVMEAAEPLGRLHDALAAKVLSLAENDLARLGWGTPPVPYAYLVFGSGGRREQTFWSDQDSGIVYADPQGETDAPRCADYFSRLARKAAALLEELGYPPCEGNVTASNPDWCLPLGEWQRKIDDWFDNPTWENVRYLLIAADARPVAGEFAYADSLKNRFFRDMLASPVIVRRMIENTLRHKVLVGPFGQLLREPYGEHAGSLDIKYGAYIPLVNVFRLQAVRAGIRETCTLRRIAALGQAGVLTAGEAEEAGWAFRLILALRLQAERSGKLPGSRLTKELESEVKRALKFAGKMQRKVEREL